MNLQELYQYDNLEFIARQVVEGFIIGLHKSPYHGFSVEFAEHRIYNAGESTKYIDWKVFARTDKKFVKRFEEETNLRCQIIIDTSSSMYFPEEKKDHPAVSKIRFSMVSAAALMRLFKKQRDAVGLSLFSDKIETHTPAKATNVHHKFLTTQLSNLVEGKARLKKTNASQCLHQIADNIHKRSLVVIFSDMMEKMHFWQDEAQDKNHELFSALQHLKYNKHEVILFHVVDKQQEFDFEFDNRPYQFIDVETGDKIKLQPNEIKDYYITHMKKFEKELKLKCAQYQIDFITADINQGFNQILMPYLVKRSKMF